MRQPTAGEAAWIRGHAWTPAMRRTHRTVPGLTSTCACQSGLTSWCWHDQHGRCHRAAPLGDVHTFICGPDGETVLSFPQPYTHPTDTATGPRRTYAAQVWLADRVCRWVCPCDCHDALFTLAEVAA